MSYTDGARFAQENGKSWNLSDVLTRALECLFLEGSAKTGEGVAQAFTKITQTIIYKIDSGEIPEDELSTRKPAADTSTSVGTGNTAKGSACGGCSLF